jgi:hypothetical protein
MLLDFAKERIPITDRNEVVDVVGLVTYPDGRIKETSYDMAHFLVRKGMKELIKQVDQRKKKERRVIYEEL